MVFALFQKYIGFGLGRLLLEVLLQKIKECKDSLRKSYVGCLRKGSG